MKCRWLAVLFPVLMMFSGPSWSVSYLINGSAGCLALPDSSWNSSNDRCTLTADLELATGDTLTIHSSSDLEIPIGLSLLVAGGQLINNGGLLQRGTIEAFLSGLIDNNAFWDARDNAYIFSSLSSVIDNSNQIQLVNGTWDANGILYVSSGIARLSVGRSSTLNNYGTIENDGLVLVEGLLDNFGTLNNRDEVKVECGGTFTNFGTLLGIPVQYFYCWEGADGSWSNPSNWNLGVVPPAGAEVIIYRSDTTATVDFDFTHTGSIEIRRGTVRVAPGVMFDNQGEIRINIGFPGNSKFLNEGDVKNNGEISNDNQIENLGIFENYGLIERNGPLINATGAVYINHLPGTTRCGLNNEAGGTVVNTGVWEMSRTENYNEGWFQNWETGSLTLNNTLYNQNGGLVTNLGALIVTDTLTNPGLLDNDVTSTIHNRASGTILVADPDAAVYNRGRVEHYGEIDNLGIIDNSGVICGDGTYQNNPIQGVQPIASCNRPPTAVATPDGAAYECTAPTTQVWLDGTGSSDPDSDALTYSWTPVAPLANANAALTSGNFAVGTHAFTLNVTDPDNESDSDGASFTVVDTTPPVITCPSDLTVNADAACIGHADPQASATDVCVVSPVVTRLPAGSTWALGNTQVNHTANDGHGNTSSCTSHVEVVDVTTPEIQCNTSSVVANPGQPLSIQATASDNCSVSSVAITSYDCWTFNRGGKRVDKTGKCVVSISGDTINITEPSGVGTIIGWTVEASDGSGNSYAIDCQVVSSLPEPRS